MLSAVSSVAQLVEGIAHASSQQSAGIDEINRAVVQMDQNTQQNAALVEEAAASAGALQQQANTLRETVSVFVLEDGARSAAHESEARAVRGFASRHYQGTAVV